MDRSSLNTSDLCFTKQAYEKNLTDYSAALADAGEGYIQRDEDAVLTIFPYTYWSNGVVSPRFTENNAEKRINEILAVFRAHKREVWFHVGPSSQPSDLAKRLKSRGLWNFHNRPFMVCDFSNLITGYSRPAGIGFHCVHDYDVFKKYPHPIHGLVTTRRKRHIFTTYRTLDGQLPRKHWMFIAEKQGLPVGAAILYIEQATAGIYDVEVLEPYRGQGIGTALLELTCTFACDNGAKVAVLAASEKGSTFYPRFGFNTVGRYPTYYYSIKKQKLDAERLTESW
jgi:GNAT superfamily N-acetyltransferase